jgi:hypothetical protein
MNGVKTRMIVVILVVIVASVIWAVKVRRAGVARDAAQPNERELRVAEYQPFQAECERGRTTEQKFAISIKSRDRNYRGTDQAALEKKLREVRPGMDEEEVIRMAGKPSYVHAAWRNDTDLVCSWEYVLSGHQRGVDFIVDETIDIPFDKYHRAMTVAEAWHRIDSGLQSKVQ